MRCVLVGNYGVKNIGDEALQDYFLSTFPDIEWRVVRSAPSFPSEVPRLPCGFRSLFTPWWRTIHAIFEADAIVFGSGTLFTDTESGMACVIWSLYAIVARLFGVPYALAFQGVGPFKFFRWEALTRWVFKGASFLSVRDTASFHRVMGWSLVQKPVLSFDPVFSFFSSKKKAETSVRVLTIIPRMNSGQNFFDAVERKIQDKFDEVHVLLLQPSAEEAAIAKQLQVRFPDIQIMNVTSASQLLEEVSIASEVLSERFHGALAAFAMDIPCTVIAQVVGDKLDLVRSYQSTDRQLFLQKVREGEGALRSFFLTLPR